MQLSNFHQEPWNADPWLLGICKGCWRWHLSVPWRSNICRNGHQYPWREISCKTRAILNFLLTCASSNGSWPVPVNKTWTTWGREENYWLQGLCVWSSSCSFPTPSENGSNHKSQEQEPWSAKGSHSKRKVGENSPSSEAFGHISTLCALPRAKLPSSAMILLF